MKKNLTKINDELYFYRNGEKIVVNKNDSKTYPNGLTGDVSNIRGDVSGITGDVSNIRGDMSGITGNVSYIRGDVDDCEITDEERKKEIDISDLIK